MRFRQLQITAVGAICVAACTSVWAQPAPDIRLVVDRATGAANLFNQGDAIGDFDGYVVQSALGAITAGSWNSLEDQAASDWQEAGTPSANYIGELKQTTQTSLLADTGLPIGNIYSAAAAMTAAGLGNDNYEDLAFTLNNPLGAEGPETTTPAVIYNGQRIINNLVLTLNRETGQAVIENNSVLTVELDGYAFTSAVGSLDLTWNSLEDQGNSNWQEGGSNTANRLAELKPTGSTSLATGATLTLNNTFDPAAGALAAGFGVDPEDVVFEFGDIGLDDSVIGVVQYIGEITHNNLVINVDVSTGEVVIENESPHTVDIDGYTIASPSGLLDPNALTSVGGTFENANSSSTRISELDPTNGLTLAPSASVSLGNIFLGGAQELTFEFDFEAPDSTSMFGAVKYSAVAGDFDGNGVVDGFDFIEWQRDMTNRNLADWESNYGGGPPAAAAASSVPEPSALVLLLAVSGAPACVARRRAVG